MSSRSRRELVILALGAATDGVCCGVLAAVSTGTSGPRQVVFATIVLYAAAVFALGGAGARPGRAKRGGAVALAAAAAAVLFGVGRSWDATDPVQWVVVDVAYGALLVVVGAGLAGAARSPGSATKRAVRAFVLVSVALVGATAAGSPPLWATWAIAVTLVTGSLFVAAVRYETMMALTPATDRSPAWPWLLAVLGVTLLVVSLGLAITQVLQLDLIARLLGVAGAAMMYVLEWAGYLIGYAGAAAVRAIGWVIAQIGLHEIKPFEPPDSPGLPAALRTQQPEAGGRGSLPRAVILAALAAVAVAGSLAVVAFALRRVRRATPDEVEEERESVTSLRALVSDGAGRLAARVRRLVTRKPPARTPAEAVRRRYAELERRLARSGHERTPGTTVRAFLVVVGEAVERLGSEQADVGSAASAIAEIYERARYSAEPLGADAVATFDLLAFDVGAAVIASARSSPG